MDKNIPNNIHEKLWTEAIEDARKVRAALDVVHRQSKPVTRAISVFLQNCVFSFEECTEYVMPLPLEAYLTPTSFIRDITLIQTRLEYDATLYPIVGMLLSLDDPTNFEEVLSALFVWSNSNIFKEVFMKLHPSFLSSRVLPFLNKYWYLFFIVYLGEIAERRALKRVVDDIQKEGFPYHSQVVSFTKDVLSYVDNRLADIGLGW